MTAHMAVEATKTMFSKMLSDLSSNSAWVQTFVVFLVRFMYVYKVSSDTENISNAGDIIRF